MEGLELENEEGLQRNCNMTINPGENFGVHLFMCLKDIVCLILVENENKILYNRLESKIMISKIERR